MPGTLLRFDSAAAFHPQYGMQTSDLEKLAPSLERARHEMLDEDARLYRDKNVPTEKQPLDHGFFEMPVRLLAEYKKEGAKSELGRILASAERLKSHVDKVVVLGIGGSYMGAKALMDSCCAPHFNKLSRACRNTKRI